MDCKHAQLLLEFTRPQAAELEPADAEALDTHLADCPECGPQARHEQRADQHLGRAMRDVKVPADLRQRLLSRLAVERDAWYRRWLVRAAGILLAAAAVVLLIWGGVWWRNNLRPNLDPEQLAMAGEAEQPVGSAADVARWFKEKHGLTVALPGDVYYEYLTYCGVVEYRGKRVPMLTFAFHGHEGLSRARVYIVTDAQFDDLEDQVHQPPRGTRGYRIEVKSNPDNPHVYFVRVYTEGAKGRFFKPNPNRAA